MKTIAICNHKGGVGKTALSMAIAEGLHRKGKRTLLVDLDQQMNATQQAKIDTTDEVTVYDLLTSFDYTAKDGIKHFDGGDIIPGDVLVSNAESDMAKLDTRLTMLADAMEGIDDDYDYAIIDCPPSLGLVTRNAMVAADELIVPVIPNRSSLKGFRRIAIRLGFVSIVRLLTRLLMLLGELFVALQSIIQIRFRSRAGGYDFVCMLGNIHGKKIKVDTGPVIERIDNLFTDKLFTGAKTFALFLGDLRLLPFFLFLQGGDLAIDVFDTLWHGTFLSFGYYSSLSSF